MLEVRDVKRVVLNYAFDYATQESFVFRVIYMTRSASQESHHPLHEQIKEFPSSNQTQENYLPKRSK